MSDDPVDVDITGLDKAAVLAALFNASAPQGMGILQSGRGPVIMDTAFAQQLINSGGAAAAPDYDGFMAPYQTAWSYDYLYGRPLKIDLTYDNFSPRGYDRDNGGDGTARRIVDDLRANGDTNSALIQTIYMANMRKRDSSNTNMKNLDEVIKRLFGDLDGGNPAA